LRVGILTGAGDRAFCVGSDLSMYASGVVPPPLAHGYAGLTHRFDSPKPVIAAINGLCLGGGLEIMMACDLVVAAEHAEFGLPEALVGQAALGGGIPRLCRKVSYTVAMGLILTGRRFSAEQALRHGLVNEVTPRGDALSGALAMARDIVRCAPLSLQASKMIADATLRGDNLVEIMEYEDGAPKTLVMTSEDSKEGARAFLEKRAPVWKGR
jgi:crotonobetainyl-CoA hydratase